MFKLSSHFLFLSVSFPPRVIRDRGNLLSVTRTFANTSQSRFRNGVPQGSMLVPLKVVLTLSTVYNIEFVGYPLNSHTTALCCVDR